MIYEALKNVSKKENKVGDFIYPSFIGIIGAIILLVAYFLRTHEAPTETAKRPFNKTF